MHGIRYSYIAMLLYTCISLTFIDELSERHKQRRKKEIKDKVNNYLNGLQNIGLEPVSLQLKTQDEQHISVKLGL